MAPRKSSLAGIPGRFMPAPISFGAASRLGYKSERSRSAASKNFPGITICLGDLLKGYAKRARPIAERAECGLHQTMRLARYHLPLSRCACAGLRRAFGELVGGSGNSSWPFSFPSARHCSIKSRSARSISASAIRSSGPVGPFARFEKRRVSSITSSNCTFRRSSKTALISPCELSCR